MKCFFCNTKDIVKTWGPFCSENCRVLWHQDRARSPEVRRYMADFSNIVQQQQQ